MPRIDLDSDEGNGGKPETRVVVGSSLVTSGSAVVVLLQLTMMVGMQCLYVEICCLW